MGIVTDRQVEKLADLLGQLGVAAILGAAGDLVINGSRILIDLIGTAVGAALLTSCLYLIGLLRGRRMNS